MDIEGLPLFDLAVYIVVLYFIWDIAKHVLKHVGGGVLDREPEPWVRDVHG